MGNVKPSRTETEEGFHHLAVPTVGKTRKFINKEAVASIVGPREENHRQIVVMTGKEVTASTQDVFTSVPRKVVMKDLL
jgi:hypothetical protein